VESLEKTPDNTALKSPKNIENNQTPNEDSHFDLSNKDCECPSRG